MSVHCAVPYQECAVGKESGECNTVQYDNLVLGSFRDMELVAGVYATMQVQCSFVLRLYHTVAWWFIVVLALIYPHRWG